MCCIQHISEKNFNETILCFTQTVKTISITQNLNIQRRRLYFMNTFRLFINSLPQGGVICSTEYIYTHTALFPFSVSWYMIKMFLMHMLSLKCPLHWDEKSLQGLLYTPTLQMRVWICKSKSINHIQVNNNTIFAGFVLKFLRKFIFKFIFSTKTKMFEDLSAVIPLIRISFINISEIYLHYKFSKYYT